MLYSQGTVQTQESQGPFPGFLVQEWGLLLSSPARPSLPILLSSPPSTAEVALLPTFCKYLWPPTHTRTHSHISLAHPPQDDSSWFCCFRPISSKSIPVPSLKLDSHYSGSAHHHSLLTNQPTYLLSHPSPHQPSMPKWYFRNKYSPGSIMRVVTDIQ